MNKLGGALPAGWVEAVLVKVGDRDGNGRVVRQSDLMLMVDGERLFWDPARGALVYRGPGVAGCEMPTPIVVQ